MSMTPPVDDMASVYADAKRDAHPDATTGSDAVESESAPTANTPGRPKDPAKRAAILNAAKGMFLQHGYEGTSMDAIAAAAGVSKLTVYSHFKDKDTLFGAAVSAHCQGQMPSLCFDLPIEMPITQALYTVAQRFQGMIGHQEAVELYRLIVGSSAQSPKMASQFYEAGPMHGLAEMRRLLSQAHDQGKLSIPNLAFAAEYFLSAFSGCCGHMQQVLGVTKRDEAERERYTEEVVQRFIKAYSP